MPKSGKDTFAEYVGKYAKVKNFSSVDFVKEVAKFAGWDGNKTDKSRLFLSRLKELLTRFDDIPFRKTEEAIQEFKNSEEEIMFIHIRESNDISRIVNKYKAYTLIVRRPNNDSEISNDSDRFVEGYAHYDFVLNNNSDLESLDKKAVSFVRYLHGINGELVEE